jgi:hypothetical protein
MSAIAQRLPVDLADVKTVLELEPKLRQLLKDVKAIEPALERLDQSEYPGAGYLREELHELAENLSLGPERRLTCGALVALEEFRIGGGDQAALDYFEFIVEDRLTIVQAVAAIVDRSEDNAERVEAFLRYVRTRSHDRTQ